MYKYALIPGEIRTLRGQLQCYRSAEVRKTLHLTSELLFFAFTVGG